MKGRPPKDPILLLIPNPDYLPSVVREITPLARRLMERFWPGPLTIVLQASDRLVAAVTGGTGTVGVRVSTGEVASLLVSGLGQALTATSANRSGEAPAESAREVVRALRDGLELAYLLLTEPAVDGGQTPGGLPSTVVDARGEKLSLIREGRIAAADLASALA